MPKTIEKKIQKLDEELQKVDVPKPERDKIYECVYQGVSQEIKRAEKKFKNKQR